MIGLDTPIPDIDVIVNPWQALVAVAVVFAVLIWPSIAAQRSAHRIEKSLTENNGGNSVVDRFDQISAKVDDLGGKLDAHLEWSDAYVKAQEETARATTATTTKRKARKA